MNKTIILLSGLFLSLGAHAKDFTIFDLKLGMTADEVKKTAKYLTCDTDCRFSDAQKLSKGIESPVLADFSVKSIKVNFYKGKTSQIVLQTNGRNQTAAPLVILDALKDKYGAPMYSGKPLGSPIIVWNKNAQVLSMLTDASSAVTLTLGGQLKDTEMFVKTREIIKAKL